MIVTHDDLPHPVPPFAYLRYKENWFFIVMDVQNQVFGMAHFNYEPGFERARMSCNLLVKGELFKYGNQIPFPEKFAFSRVIGDGRLEMHFIEAHKQFNLKLQSDDLALDLTFLASAPTFDFDVYDAANPNKPTAKEVMGFATNQIFEHQQQATTISGSVAVKRGKLAGSKIDIKGLGYRDHSRAMRVDNMTEKHYWTGLYFPSTVFGAMSLQTVLRPGLVADSGYVYDKDGLRSLGEMAMSGEGELDGFMPAKAEFRFNDVYGKRFTIVADLANRYGYVPLVAEAASATGISYTIYENFCPILLKETGEQGVALVEMGYSSKRA